MPSFCVQRRFALFLAFILLMLGGAAAETVQPPAAGAVRRHADGCGPRKFSVVVVNGQLGRTVCVDRISPPSVEAPKNGVVILNGTQKETRVFNSTAEPSRPIRNLPPVVIGITTAGSKNSQAHPVVVGISSGGNASSASSANTVVVNVASSESRDQSANAHPVVVGIASSGSQTAGTVAPVTVGVSPRPAKRRPYRPAALDAQ